MPAPRRLIVFDALLLRALIINDRLIFPNELSAFRLAFRGRRFQILITDGIIREYQAESNRPPQFLPLPTLANLSQSGRVVRRDESELNRFSITLAGLPKEHRPFVWDAIAAGAEYLITDRQRWLNIFPNVETAYNLRIVTPGTFVELER